MKIQCPYQITLQQARGDEFADYLFDKFTKYGCNLAMIDLESGKQWCYSELRVWTENCVKRLQEIGVKRGSRCALISSNTSQAIFVYIACAILDAVVISVNANLSAGEIWAQIDNGRAKYCFTEQQYLSKIEDVKRIATIRSGGRISSFRLLDEILDNKKLTQKPLKKRISAASSCHEEITPKATNKPLIHAISCFDFSSAGQNHQDAEQSTSPNSSQPRQAVIIFYSISQSKFPKPAEVTHRSLLYNLQQLSCSVFGPPNVHDKCLLAANMHHAFGLVTAFLTLSNGAQLFVTSKQNPRNVIGIIKELEVTIAYVFPKLIHQCSKDAELEKSDFTLLRSIVTSGAPIGETTMQLCKKRLKLKDLRQAYSVTEAGGICCLAPYGCENLQTVGVPLPGLLFKIANLETKDVCMPRELGQILIEGPPVEVPVHENSKQPQAFESGFLKTGDIGYYDNMGHIFVLNKIKDIVKYKGVMLCPSELENVLHSHPGIDDCAVVGRQEQMIGAEIPAVFVVKNPHYQQLASNEIRQFAAGKIPYFKDLRSGVYFVSEIPRNACGKILRHQLKQTWDRMRIAYHSISNNIYLKIDNAYGTTNTQTKTTTNSPSKSLSAIAGTTVNATKIAPGNKGNRTHSNDSKNTK